MFNSGFFYAEETVKINTSSNMHSGSEGDSLEKIQKEPNK